MNLNPVRAILLRELRKVVEQGIKEGELKFQDDMDAMTDYVISKTDKTGNFPLVGITYDDVKKMLMKLKEKKA